MYTIGQVSEQFDLPVSTLRYYDKEGLFPALTRTSGIRRFGEQELEALRVIECLKRSGLEIKEIKQFMEWCAQGSETYPQRHALFVQQAERVEAEIARLQKSLDMIRFKCWYYEQAMRDGSEDRVHAMPPKLRSRNFPGMELIRPMYCIHEDDIIAWQRYNGLEFIQCACRFTERAAAHGNDGSSSKRQEVKLLLRELRRTNPDIEKSIFHSIHSVCLDTMVGYKSGGVEHTFADCYRERGEMAEMEKEDAE